MQIAAQQATRATSGCRASGRTLCLVSRPLAAYFSLLLLLLVQEYTCAAQSTSPRLNPSASSAHFNRDESAVPAYTEPDLLTLLNGVAVKDKQTWFRQRRPELLDLLSDQMFGQTPSGHLDLRIEQTVSDSTAFGGLATRKQLTLGVAHTTNGPKIHVLLYLPNRSERRVPVILGLNYAGNESVSNDPGIRLGTVWMPDADNRLKQHPQAANESMRGSAASQWPIERLLACGYAFATVYDGDLEPDFDGGISHGFRPLFFAHGQTKPADDDWGAIGVWAWGISRVADVLQKEKRVDPRRIIVIGHSRLGKAALWAGAQDTRFAAVISNESGKGGAALMKRDFGETVEHLNVRFPYWFCKNFHRYNTSTQSMSFDSPMLLSLIAPRPLYIASADGDYTLDAKGEFLAASQVSHVYDLLGAKGLDTEEMPALDQPIMNTVGYHDRPGKHDMTSYDWDQYLKFLQVLN